MGLNPIEYRPWKGERTEHGRRFLVIADEVFRQKTRSIWLIGLFIFGGFLVHGLSLLMLSMTPHASLTAQAMSQHMQDSLFFIFSIILVSMVCCDLVAEDLRSNSLVLYLSRALRAERYLLGKVIGAFTVISIFTLVLPLSLAVAITVTQSGSDYISSAAVIGETAVMGFWMTLLLMPIGLMLSTLTTRRTYAAVGTFMTFFVLQVIAGIFSSYDSNWQLLGVQNVISRSSDVIFGLGLPSDIDPILLLLMSVVLVLPPVLITYLQVHKREVGK